MVRKQWILAALVLGLLCMVVPFSSRSPDAVQTLLRLPGGVDHFLKAVGGVLVTVSVIFILGRVLQRFKFKS